MDGYLFAGFNDIFKTSDILQYTKAYSSYHVFPFLYISTLKGILKTLYKRFKETRSQTVESEVVRGSSNKARHLKKKINKN